MTPADPVREHYTAIGLVTAEWSEFEWLIDEYCYEVAGYNQRLGLVFQRKYRVLPESLMRISLLSNTKALSIHSLLCTRLQKTQQH
jgi:hypothetical protein